MTTTPIAAAALSRWWVRATIATMAIGFAVLILLTAKAYQNAPPIPARAIDPSGKVIFTNVDIERGQQVFLEHGLMDNGTVWGHGAYLGPDFSAQYLHALALDLAEQIAHQRFARAYNVLAAEDRDAVAAIVAAHLKQNHYDPRSRTLTLPPGASGFFDQEVGYWTKYFADPATNGGLRAGVVIDPAELRALTAFFAWTAWASVAERPGTSHSYTNNFPYDPLAGNRPTAGAVLWSAISLIFLLSGTAIVLFAFGEFGFLGWRNATVGARTRAFKANEGQIAALKFMVAAALLFLIQALVGGGTAHYRADPTSFYGFDLTPLFPSNLLRTWHLQLSIFWIATAYIGGALFVASILSGNVSPGLRRGINFLFALLIVVVVGSLSGEWAGLFQWLPHLWFWLGDQGWEYLEIGRWWQYALVAGLTLWVYLQWRVLSPARSDPERRELANFLLIAAAAIPTFYVPALFFGSTTNYTVVDAWRFWIIHLWVEGFFEFFVTVIVAVILFELGLVERLTALRVIYLDAVLYFSGGVIGTGHHWYFTGQTELNMALAAAFSALEVVPLTLLTLDAWDFVRVTRNEGPELRHRWTFYFLLAVGVWNFVGAGIFGFLINLPIVSYYEVGTMLTPNHAHAAMMGVFGMLALALMTFVLREAVTDTSWIRLRKYVKCAFLGLNVGLAMMVAMSLFPGGVLQVRDVLAHGYWHARSFEYTGSGLARLVEWLRLPGDLIFIFLGALPLAIVMTIGCRVAWQRPRRSC